MMTEEPWPASEDPWGTAHAMFKALGILGVDPFATYAVPEGRSYTTTIPVVPYAPTSIRAKLERGDTLTEDERYVLSCVLDRVDK